MATTTLRRRRLRLADVSRVTPANMPATLLPGVMMATSVGFIAVRGLNPASLMTGGIVVVSRPGMKSGGRGNRRGARKTQVIPDGNDYLAYRAQTREHIDDIRTVQRAALVWPNPVPNALDGGVVAQQHARGRRPRRGTRECGCAQRGAAHWLGNGRDCIVGQ